MTTAILFSVLLLCLHITNATRLITDPSACVRDSECPINSICDTRNRCVVNQNYRIREFECKECKTGIPCRVDGHCIGSGIFCNKPSGNIGFCVGGSKLIKQLGKQCNPKMDLCDAARGLSCQWAKSVKSFVCQQRSGARYTPAAYCTPNNKFSRCEHKDGVLHTCRSNPNDPFYGIYGCTPVTEYIRRGKICGLYNSFDTRCEKGTECKVIPGVSYNVPRTPFSTGIAPFEACVNVVKTGMPCKNKFLTGCESGSQCKNGMCVPGTYDPFSGSTKTHAGNGQHCSPNGIPCAPGLECVEGSCKVRRVFLKKGDYCVSYPLVNRVCPSGLVCARKEDGWSVKRCRVAGGVGTSCDDDKHCTGDLICSTAESKLPPYRRFCYDQKKTRGLGGECTPGKNMCVEIKGKTSCTSIGPRTRCSKEDDTELRCLPKGAGRFTCQKVGLLYDKCSPQANMGCEKGLVCYKGICVP